jgi:hypothetical protein
MKTNKCSFAHQSHHAQVFRVEAPTRVVRDDPDCAEKASNVDACG